MLDPIYYIKPLLYNSDFQRPWERSILETLLEKEKMLVNSIFSVSHYVFYLSKNTFLHLFCRLQTLLNWSKMLSFREVARVSTWTFHQWRKSYFFFFKVTLQFVSQNMISGVKIVFSRGGLVLSDFGADLLILLPTIVTSTLPTVQYQNNDINC